MEAQAENRMVINHHLIDLQEINPTHLGRKRIKIEVAQKITVKTAHNQVIVNN
jgi:hypothetical protein